MSADTKSDKANRLTPVESYQYDAGGRRIATAIGTNVVRHVYAGMHVIADTDAAGNLLRSYTWGPGIDNLLALTVYGPGGTNTYQAISDHLGTVHALMDENGDTVERYEYDAWGNVLGVFDGNGGSLPSSVIGLRYLFQGREYSWAIHAVTGGTGLYNFRARYYDSLTGRWLSNDPIGISGGLNQYAFCANNPVMFGDPRGNDPRNIGGDPGLHYLGQAAQAVVDAVSSAVDSFTDTVSEVAERIGSTVENAASAAVQHHNDMAQKVANTVASDPSLAPEFVAAGGAIMGTGAEIAKAGGAALVPSRGLSVFAVALGLDMMWYGFDIYYGLYMATKICP